MRRKALITAVLAVGIGIAAASAALAMNARTHEKMDKGPEPYADDLAKLTRTNRNYRTAVWTGDLLQLTVMCIPAKGEIGLEVHEDTDQFIYIVEGAGKVMMGEERDSLTYCKPVGPGSAVFVPHGTWHNLVNDGSKPAKLFTVYAPPHHPHGTVHETKEIADAAEH
jgi:mannose-6-phosphate isomerase-like protein (cupin superfamily)